MTQISILGCGWLGLPLAKALVENGFSVNGSTTSTEKLSILENSEIQPFLIYLTPALSLRGTKQSNEDGVETGCNIDDFLQESKTLIINIPPKLRENSKNPSPGGSGVLRAAFVGKIATLIPYIEKSTIENVLFISSTSVYGDDTSTALSVTEETKPQPDTESGKQLLEAETLLQSNKNFKTTVLRFGGLIGEDRHPVNFLAGRENLENPKAPINLIRQEDCIGIILKIIERNCWNKTFNAVAPFHPSREDYYTQKARNLNLALPKFNYEMPTFGKTILSEKVEKVLEFKFTITNL